MSVFPPDSFLVVDVTPSPNFDERKDDRPPDMIVLHYTGMQTGAVALQRLTTAASKVSAHYVVFEDGRIVQCVPEERRAWHAGESSWAGENDINSRSIGIEIVNAGHELGYSDFPLRQIAATISLCKSIITRRGPISADRILAHSDVAPARKQDPGEKFPWGLLSESGVGHWVRAAPLDLEGTGLSMVIGASQSRDFSELYALTATVLQKPEVTMTPRARWSPHFSAILGRRALMALQIPRRFSPCARSLKRDPHHSADPLTPNGPVGLS
jgi:N-acetylmuramoyl-L-alanine amidase